MTAKLFQSTIILRNYRHMTQGKFHEFNQKVRNNLAESEKIDGSLWAGRPTLIPSYMAASEQHDAVYHQALYGSKLDIAKRDVLQAQIIDYLDEIAAILEAAAVRNPEILLVSGFDLAKERRGRHRSNVVQTVSEETNASNQQPSS